LHDDRHRFQGGTSTGISALNHPELIEATWDLAKAGQPLCKVKTICQNLAGNLMWPEWPERRGYLWRATPVRCSFTPHQLEVKKKFNN
jgi:hypothetical protein